MKRFSAIPLIALLLLSIRAEALDLGAESITVDLDGNGATDMATLQQTPEKVTVVIEMTSERGQQPQVLTFGVDCSRHDAVCVLPAIVTAVPLSCTAMDETLPGCVASSRAQAIRLSGGECDAIYLYWDSSRRQVAWWRL